MIWGLSDRIWSRKKYGGVVSIGTWTCSASLCGKSMQRIAFPPSWAGIALDLKVLRSLAACCSNKVYVSDVNTAC